MPNQSTNPAERAALLGDLELARLLSARQQARERPDATTWRTAPPTLPGWYWTTSNPPNQLVTQCVLIELTDLGPEGRHLVVLRAGDDTPLLVKDMAPGCALWCGPIVPPQADVRS